MRAAGNAVFEIMAPVRNRIRQLFQIKRRADKKPLLLFVIGSDTGRGNFL
jgi:hypothetical protein